jgi:hypothetical protein
LRIDPSCEIGVLLWARKILALLHRALNQTTGCGCLSSKLSRSTGRLPRWNGSFDKMRRLCVPSGLYR